MAEEKKEQSVVEINNEILGYGKKLKVLVGTDDKGQEDIIEYHFSPVPIADIPKLVGFLDNFFKHLDKGAWNKDSVDAAGEMIRMCLIKMHPQIKLETVLQHFTLAALGKAVSLVMDLNDFLSELETIQEIMGQAEQMSKTVSKSRSN